MSRYEVKIPAVIVRQAQLPANAFTMPDPNPKATSCTVASAGRDVAWHFRDWQFRTTFYDRMEPNETYSLLVVKLVSSALGEEIVDLGNSINRALTPYLPGYDPTTVLTARERSVHALGWSLRFDPLLMYLELNHSWYCEDKDPSRP